MSSEEERILGFLKPNPKFHTENDLKEDYTVLLGDTSLTKDKGMWRIPVGAFIFILNLDRELTKMEVIGFYPMEDSRLLVAINEDGYIYVDCLTQGHEILDVTGMVQEEEISEFS